MNGRTIRMGCWWEPCPNGGSLWIGSWRCGGMKIIGSLRRGILSGSASRLTPGAANENINNFNRPSFHSQSSTNQHRGLSINARPSMWLSAGFIFVFSSLTSLTHSNRPFTHFPIFHFSGFSSFFVCLLICQSNSFPSRQVPSLALLSSSSFILLHSFFPWFSGIWWEPVLGGVRREIDSQQMSLHAALGDPQRRLAGLKCKSKSISPCFTNWIDCWKCLFNHHSIIQSFIQSLNHSIIQSSLNHSITHSINHSIIQSFNQSLNHSIIHSITHSINHSIIQSFIHSINHSIIQSFNQSITQSFNHSIIQSINHSINQSLNHSIRFTSEPASILSLIISCIA